MANNPYPNPTNGPQSLKVTVARMYADCGYAQFIREQIAKAVAGDAAAKQTVDANFKAMPVELDQLGIPKTEQPNYALCTDPKTRLLAVADVKTAS
jgi:hypothetical protein